MTRRKIADAQKLVVKVTVRLTTVFYKKLEKWTGHSNCRSVTEFLRRMILKEQIIWYHREVGLEPVAVELAAIRKELNAIGRNINQIVRHFNSVSTTDQKLFEAMKAEAEYRKVGVKVDKLQQMISEIMKKWLQK